MKRYLMFAEKINKALLTGVPYEGLSLHPATSYNEVYKQREKMWQQFLQVSRKHNKPLIILLGGCSNVGKSSWAMELAFRLGICNVIHTDTVRNTLRQILSPNKYPAVHASSYASWKAVSKQYSKDALWQGFRRQSQIIQPYLESIIEDALDYGKFTLIEGMHVSASLINKYRHSGHHLLSFTLDVRSANDHMKRLNKRCQSTYLNRRPQKYMSRDREFRALRDYLYEEAQRCGSIVISNRHKKKTLDLFMEHMFSYVSKVLVDVKAT